MVFTLVPWYLYWFQGIYIDVIVFILVPWYLYWCHGIYIGAILFIMVPWYLYWWHGIYNDAMVFILVPLYLYWCPPVYQSSNLVGTLRLIDSIGLRVERPRPGQAVDGFLDILADPSPILMPTLIQPCLTCVLGLCMCYIG